MAEVLDEDAKIFDLNYFEDEGHLLYHEVNRVEARDAIEAFIRRYTSPVGARGELPACRSRLLMSAERCVCQAGFRDQFAQVVGRRSGGHLT